MNSENWMRMHDREMERIAPRHEPFKVNLPDGRSGDWEVDHFEVVKGIEQMRCAMDGRPVPCGRYTRLSRHGRTGLFMTDTPAELNDARELFWSAEGHVLITGLGIGMVPHALFKPEIERFGGRPDAVTKVTIVEKEPDVIKLVAPSLEGLPVEIVEGDAFTWTPPAGTKFDWAWHDIWPTICSDDIVEHGKLRNHYKRFMSAPARQLVWAERECKRERRRDFSW